MAKDTSVKPKPLQIISVDEDIQRQFRMYMAEYDMTQAQVFTKAFKLLLASEKK